MKCLDFFMQKECGQILRNCNSIIGMQYCLEHMQWQVAHVSSSRLGNHVIIVVIVVAVLLVYIPCRWYL